jgi:hypothetical protein
MISPWPSKSKKEENYLLLASEFLGFVNTAQHIRIDYENIEHQVVLATTRETYFSIRFR